MTPLSVSRRRLLAGLGAGSVTSVTGLALFTDESVRYPNTAYAAGPTVLRIEWRATYNGAVVSPDVTADDGGPVLSVGGLAPSDSGTLGMAVSPVDGEGEPVFDARVTESRENGRTDPERSAGDDSPDRGELEEFVRMRVWRDDGSFGFDRLGARNVARDAGEQVVAEGPLSAVTQSISGLSLGCLGEGETAHLALEWTFDGTRGDPNRAQGDAVGLDFGVRGEPCSTTVGREVTGE